MATIDIAGLPPRDVLDFLDTLDVALAGLDDLAQIQAACGTLGMQSRASKTENTLAKLNNFVRQLRAAHERVNR